MRGRRDTPSPPRDRYGRRRRNPSPRRRERNERDNPKSLLVRNLRFDCRPDDLRLPFEQFGPLKDVYLPRDYYTGEPRGFGFVQFADPADAVEAKYQMDGEICLGKELTVEFATENRKKPDEMRARDRVRSRSYDRRRSPRYSRSPPRRSARYCSPPRRSARYRSPPRRSARYRSRSRSYSRRRDYSRSTSHVNRRAVRERRSRSISRHSRGKSYSKSPARSESSSRSGSPIKDS